MRRELITALFTIMAAGAAQAGGPTAVLPEPAAASLPAPAAVTDWSGAYLGVAVGRSTGDIAFDPPVLGLIALDDGTDFSAHLGYQVQRGNWVFGGELAYSKLDNGLTSETCCTVDSAIDLKGRVGYAANRVLVYGVLGYSVVNYDEGSFGDYDMSGLAYGLGLDYRATERVNVGLEYLARDVSGDYAPPREVSVDLNAIALRVGLKF